MKDWIIISYFTVGTGYETEIKNLTKSLKFFDLPYFIFNFEPQGTWRRNLNFKSQCILEAFKMFPDRDIVFLDADAIVRQYPKLFDQLSKEKKYHIGAHFFRYLPRSGDPDELLSGTLWIRNDEIGHRIVNRWHKLGLKYENIRHQKCLKLALNELIREGLNIQINHFPFEYTCIFDYHKARQGKAPVIEHFQASRRFRKSVGYGVPLVPGQRKKTKLHTQVLAQKPLTPQQMKKMRNVKKLRDRVARMTKEHIQI